MPGLNVRVYQGRVTGVDADRRLISFKSNDGAVFQDISYLMPWMSLMGGGIDYVPKTEDKCLVLAEAGRGSFAVCIGFEMPIDAAGSRLGDRYPGLPQGSVAVRAHGEAGKWATLVFLPNGTMLLSSTPTCRTLYSPVDNSITSIFDNYELKGPGGWVRWRREEGGKKVRYEARYCVSTDHETGKRVDVVIGGDDNPVEIEVGEATYPHPYLKLVVDDNGEVFLTGESLNVVGRAGVTIDAPQVTIKGRQVLGQGDPI